MSLYQLIPAHTLVRMIFSRENVGKWIASKDQLIPAHTLVRMIFSRENVGKWIASKAGKVVDKSKKLETLLKRVEKREDRKEIWFDRIPSRPLVGGSHAV